MINIIFLAWRVGANTEKYLPKLFNGSPLPAGPPGITGHTQIRTERKNYVVSVKNKYIIPSQGKNEPEYTFAGIIIGGKVKKKAW
jgi:hypothetical protein